MKTTESHLQSKSFCKQIQNLFASLILFFLSLFLAATTGILILEQIITICENVKTTNKQGYDTLLQ